ncbi:MAG: N-acetyltransferase, partial [Methanocalculus sp. MSAO_Arc2]|uniref:GNAT family N-acetyltransferase n=1 Tax=Methanocalculus sp. MSAO_Arc2 TaxID=2293855 RepID=UPI000FF5536D
LRILCNYAFNYLNIHKIYCKTDNQYAARLYEKVGFSHEGTLHEHAFHYGKYIDKFVYGLLSRDYLKK